MLAISRPCRDCPSSRADPAVPAGLFSAAPSGAFRQGMERSVPTHCFREMSFPFLFNDIHEMARWLLEAFLLSIVFVCRLPHCVYMTGPSRHIGTAISLTTIMNDEVLLLVVIIT
jgi:hypothetical protein